MNTFFALVLAFNTQAECSAMAETLPNVAMRCKAVGNSSPPVMSLRPKMRPKQ